MAWNQPGNNGQDNDPWGNNKKKPTGSSGDFFDKVNDLFKKGTSHGGGGPTKVNLPFKFPVLIGGVLVVIAAIWAISGFYTVSQSQRGVITRFGQVQKDAIVQPGLNWKPSLIDQVYIVDTQGTRNFNVKGFMITAGENLVFVEMNVQYRISNPVKYLFNVTNVEDSLSQAADSALRTEIGSTNMDSILTNGRSQLETRTKKELVDIIGQYDMGISIVDLNFQSARPPEQVQDAFNDAIKAREDREREINKAEADKVQVVQQAEGRSARILADANSYRVRIELEAEGDVARFEKLLPQYKAAPEITRERLYIETMEKILSTTSKVIVNDNSGNLLVLPLEQVLKNRAKEADDQSNSNSSNGYNMDLLNSATNNTSNSSSSNNNNDSSTRNTGSGNTTRTTGR